jgi:ornithine decarboxylase
MVMMGNHRLSAIIPYVKQSYRPVAIYNRSKVIHRVNWWKLCLPHITPYYAIKSFADRCILSTLADNNVGFDVASKCEIKRAHKYSQNLILSHPIKSVHDILAAKENKVKQLVCDSEAEASKVSSIYPEAEIIWRIKSVEDFSVIKFNSKFGSTIEEARDVLKGPYNIVGISFHVGSKCLNMNAYSNTIDTILSDIYPYFDKNNKRMKLIDIGGGFNDEEDILELKHSLSKFKLDTEKYNIKMIAEPGRYFSKECLTLYTKVLAVKHINDVCHVFINDSIYNTFSGKQYDHQTFIPFPMYSNNKCLKKCIIWGNTCDGDDVIVNSIEMPVPIVGDVIKWDGIGAYSLASSVNGFNGFKKPLIHTIDYLFYG